MPDLWPFNPSDRVAEFLSWYTDINTSVSSEMRYAGRPVRQAFSYQTRLSATELSEAEGLFEQNAIGEWYVPLWSDHSRGGDVSSGDTVIPCDTDGSYEANGELLLWQDRANYVQKTISSIGVGTITLTATVGQNLTNPAIVPIRTGYCRAGLSHRRAFANDVFAECRFELRSADETQTSPYGTYLSLPVVTDQSYSVSPLTGRLWAQVAVLDDDIAPATLASPRDVLDGLYALNARQDTITQVRDWRRWLNYLRGRDGVFWLSRRSRDLIAQAPIGASDTVITVAPIYATLAEYVGKDISINGTYFRDITAAAANGANVDISITTLGVGLTDPEISFIRKYRLDTDLVEIAHDGGGGFSALTLKEVL